MIELIISGASLAGFVGLLSGGLIWVGKIGQRVKGLEQNVAALNGTVEALKTELQDTKLDFAAFINHHHDEDGFATFIPPVSPPTGGSIRRQ